MLVDDHPLWRQMLRQILEHKRVGTVVAEASDGEEAVSLASSLEPDIVIMDVDLPGISGIEATRRLVSGRPGAKVLVLSGFEEKTAVIEAVQAGASGYLLKTAAAGEVTEAIGRIHEGEVVFPPSLATIVMQEFRRLAERDAKSARVLEASAALPHQRRVPRGETAGQGDAPDMANAFMLEGEFWTLVYAGEVVRIRASKGMGYIARLIAAQGGEVHVSDLVASWDGGLADDPKRKGALVESGLRRGVLADAGPMLDPAAKAAYRRRLQELESEVEEAEAWSDLERSAKAKEEIDFLTRELATALGLGGRDRRAASPTERARLNVSRAIKSAIERIAGAHPALGTHLDRAIHTGTFCSYQPSEPIQWLL